MSRLEHSARMTSRSRKPTSHQPAAGRLVHRANDLVLGHVGRVIYVPRRRDGEANDDESEADHDAGGVGKLYINRLVNDVPSFREIIPFDEWFPPSAPEELPRPSAGQRALRSQQRWLFRSHPEAFLGNTGLKSCLREEIRLLANDCEKKKTNGSGGAFHRLPLLSIGEITDANDKTRVTACPALAMASGDLGDTLRVVRLRNDRRRWPNVGPEGGVSLHMAMPDINFEGSWCEEGVPIIHIRFVSYQKQNRPVRWLIAQTALSTMIFSPEVAQVPVWNAGGRSGQYLRDRSRSLSTPSYISVSPIVVVKTGQTGGFHHSDVCFSPASSSKPPQLAIIDRNGGYTVWAVHRSRMARDNSLKVVLLHSGRLSSEPTSVADLDWDPSSYMASRDEQCRVAWITPVTKNTRRRRGVVGPSRSDGNSMLLNDDRYPPDDGVPALQSTRLAALLLCNRKVLKILDAQTDTSSSYVELVNLKKAENIVDVCVCPQDASRIFVLTSTSLFWLELAFDAEQNAYSSTVLLSCPHLRSPLDESLQLSILPTHLPRDIGAKAWLVCIFSATSTRVTLFTFTASQSQGQASFHHQTVHLGTTNDNASFRTRSLAMKSARVSPRLFQAQGETTTGGGGQRFSPANHQFVQVLVLGENFSLYSSLCAISSEEDHQEMPIPVRSYDFKRGEAKMKRLWNYFRGSFVIRDDLAKALETRSEAESHTRVVVRKPLLDKTALGKEGRNRGQRVPVLDLAPVVRVVTSRMMSKTRNATAASPRTGGDVPRGVLAVVKDVIRAGMERGHLPLTTIFAAAGDHLGDFEVDIQGSRWTEELEELRGPAGERVRISDLALWSSTTDVSSLSARLLHLWSSGLAPGILDSGALAMREIMIGNISVEVFLSQFGISVLAAVPLTKNPPGENCNIGLPSPSVTPPPSSQLSQPLSSPLTQEQKGGRNHMAICRDAAAGSETQPDPDLDLGPEKVEEDPAAMRLARYAVSIGSVPRQTTETVLLSHWPREAGSSDPHHFTWSWESKASTNRLEAGKRAREARHQRRLERRAMLGLSVKPESAASTMASTAILPSTQPAPRILNSSQVRVNRSQTPGSSQLPQSQVSAAPGVISTMSQPVGGRHGGRPLAKKGRTMGFR